MPVMSSNSLWYLVSRSPRGLLTRKTSIFSPLNLFQSNGRLRGRVDRSPAPAMRAERGGAGAGLQQAAANRIGMIVADAIVHLNPPPVSAVSSTAVPTWCLRFWGHVHRPTGRWSPSWARARGSSRRS